jgi:hypothetical protein
MTFLFCCRENVTGNYKNNLVKIRVMCQFSTYFFQELFKRSCPPNNNPGGFGNAFVSAVVATLTIRENGITLLRTMKLFNKKTRHFFSLYFSSFLYNYFHFVLQNLVLGFYKHFTQNKCRNDYRATTCYFFMNPRTPFFWGTAFFFKAASEMSGAYWRDPGSSFFLMSSATRGRWA